jgi:hypothetical protein
MSLCYSNYTDGIVLFRTQHLRHAIIGRDKIGREQNGCKNSSIHITIILRSNSKLVDNPVRCCKILKYLFT